MTSIEIEVFTHRWLAQKSRSKIELSDMSDMLGDQMCCELITLRSFVWRPFVRDLIDGYPVGPESVMEKNSIE